MLNPAGKPIGSIRNVVRARRTPGWLSVKIVYIDKVPQTLTARIAADSKYWLWINGRLVVFEGGLKRGPSPYDTYYDPVEIAPYLQNGENTIAVLVWHFGKSGFSHVNSGLAALLFEAVAPGVEIVFRQELAMHRI